MIEFYHYSCTFADGKLETVCKEGDTCVVSTVCDKVAEKCCENAFRPQNNSLKTKYYSVEFHILTLVMYFSVHKDEDLCCHLNVFFFTSFIMSEIAN